MVVMYIAVITMAVRPMMYFNEGDMERLLRSIESLPFANMKPLPDHLKRVLERAFFIVGATAEAFLYSLEETILPTSKASLKLLHTNKLYSDFSIAAWKRAF